jgi:excisionase family DNA binding protein
VSHRLRSSSEGTAAQGGISTGADGVARFFTIAEVAEIIQVAPRSVRRWISAGHLTVHRFGSSIVRIAESDLAKFLDKNRW